MHEAFSIRRLVIILEHVVARFSKAPVIQRARAESLIACWLGRKKRSERERRERGREARRGTEKRKRDGEWDGESKREREKSSEARSSAARHGAAPSRWVY